MTILVLPGMTPKEGGTFAWSGPGSFPLFTGSRIARVLSWWNLQSHQLCVLGTDYNKRDWERIGKAQWNVPILRPDATIPGYPHGFEGNAETCEQLKSIWVPQNEGLYRRASHLSAGKAGTLGLNVMGATPGGHIAMVYEDALLAKKYFPRTRHVLFLPLPSQERLLWKNLRTYGAFPDDLEWPCLLVDNKHRLRIDAALPALHTIFLSGEKIGGQRTLLEAFGLLCEQYSLFGMADSSFDIPVVDVSFWLKIRGYQPGVRDEDVLHAAADVLYSVLQPESKLIDCDDPDVNTPTFVTVAGMPIPQKRRATAEDQKRFTDNVEMMVKERMRQNGQQYPNDITIVWSYCAPMTWDRFLHLQAVRLFPIKDRTARWFVDRMLAS